MKHWIADRLRQLADRIDYKGAPKAMSYSFTFEDRRGIVFRADGKGCPLWYLGDADYARAHDEADAEHVRVDWAALSEGQRPWAQNVGGKPTVLRAGSFVKLKGLD